MKTVPIIFIVLMLWPVRLLSQTDTKTVITGKIIDAETGGALDKAIVYLANTALGNSSGKDGLFKISFVPRGEYQMVISRVGYERQTLTVKIEKTDSLYYAITLHPQPIRTNEIEVLGERPKELKLRYGGMLFPKDKPKMYCVYSPVSAVPVGVFYSDSAYYMYSLETTVIDSQKFIRLWLLYKNQSNTPYSFDSKECVKLHMTGTQHSYTDIKPLPPSTVYAITDSFGTIASMRQTVGKSIINLAIQRSKFMLQMGYFISSDLLEPKPIEDWSLSGTMYGVYRRSVAYGVLDSYMVHPGASVNGYIYFSFPGGDAESLASGYFDPLEYVYQIEIMTQTGSKFLEFEPR
ncbi:MAG: carboxypeptidase-like regulatory domain-containing protein [Bacteroidota bacterium]